MRKSHPVRNTGIFDNDGKAAVGLQQVEDAVATAAGHCAAEDTPGRVGDHVVKPSFALGRNLVDKILERLAFPPVGDAASGHKQEKRAVSLNGVAADGLADVQHKTMGPGRRVVAIEFSRRDIEPIEATFVGMP